MQIMYDITMFLILVCLILVMLISLGACVVYVYGEIKEFSFINRIAKKAKNKDDIQKPQS
jgi:hypothetical protein